MNREAGHLNQDRHDQPADSARTSASSRSIVGLAGKLAVVTVLMFGFGYALVPLYDLICDITGLNGTTGVVSDAKASVLEVDESRTVKVQFISTVNSSLDWDFAPVVDEMMVHPGKVYETEFVAVNRASAPVTGQAVPSVAPVEGARYFNKTECFCFTKQTLAAGERKQMPVRFVVDTRIDPDIEEVTLSYTFFATKDG